MIKGKLANASQLPTVPFNAEDILFLNNVNDSQLSHKMVTGPHIHSSEESNIFSAPSVCNNGSTAKIEQHWISTRTRSRRKAQGDESNANVVIPVHANGIISQVITKINDTSRGINDELYIDGQVSEMEHDASKVSKKVASINVTCSRSFGTFNLKKKAKYSNKIIKASQLFTDESTKDTSASRKVDIRQKEQPTESNEKELSAALDVIKEVMAMDEAMPFNNPISSDVLPEYYEVIHTPMDFGSIRCYLEQGHKYMKSEDVYKDVNLIWVNCYKYNKKGDYILHLMKRVKKKFMKCWLAAGLCLEMPNNGHLDLLASTVSASECRTHHNGVPINTLSITSKPQQQDQLGCLQAHTTQVMPCQQLPHADMVRPSSSPCHLNIPSCSQRWKSFTNLEYSQLQNDSDNAKQMGNDFYAHGKNRL